MSQLEKYKDLKGRIVEVLDSTAVLLSDLDRVREREAVEDLKRKTEEGKFSIMVAGQFSAGKSTFLNALMGNKFLPSFTKETTAAINYLRSVKESPTGQPLLRVKYRDGRVVESDDVTLETVTKYVSTDSEVKVADEVESVEIFLDSPYLNDGVMLVDSPGLNGTAEGHAEITKQEFRKTHAGIFMFCAAAPGQKTDYDILHEMKNQCDSIIFVLNKIDQIKANENETPESVIENLRKNYKKQFPDEKLPEIWPVDSYQALVARNNKPLEYREKFWDTPDKKEQLLGMSRIEAFEERLMRYLTQGEKTIMELKSPVEHVLKTLGSIAEDLNTDLAVRKENISLEEVDARIAALQEEIGKLEREVKDQSREIKKGVKTILEETRRAINTSSVEIKRRYLKRLESSEEELDGFKANARQTVRRLEGELVSSFMSHLEDADRQLRTLLRDQIADLSESMEERLNAVSVGTELNVGHISLDPSLFDIDVEIDLYLQNRKKLREELHAIEDRQDETELKFRASESARMERERLRKELEAVKHNYREERNNLGKDPGVEQKTRKVERENAGIYRLLANVYFGKGGKKYVDEYYWDDTEHRNWVEAKDYLDAEYRDERETLKDQLSEIERKISSEDLEFKRRQLERQFERKQEELKELRLRHEADMQKQKGKKLNDAKWEVEAAVEQFERDTLSASLKRLAETEKEIAETIMAVAEELVGDSLKIKKAEWERLKLQRTEDAEANRNTIQLIEERLEEIKRLMNDALNVKMDIDEIETDKIEMS